MYQICSKLTIKKLGWCYWPHSGAFIVVNFEHIPHIVLVIPLVGFEEVNTRWGGLFLLIYDKGEMIKLQCGLQLN